MAEAKVSYLLTMGAEGGYANDPDDTGGETYKGISRVNNPKWYGWQIIDAVTAKYAALRVRNYQLYVESIDKELKNNVALQNNVQAYYKANYWDVNNLDLVQNQKIASELFDTGVNMGVGTAAKFVQRSLNLLNKNQRLYKNITVDGKIGPVTVSLINGANPTQLLKCLNGFQFMRYVELMEKNEVQEKFFTSWLSRVEL